jgi:hypothetical protein
MLRLKGWYGGQWFICRSRDLPDEDGSHPDEKPHRSQFFRCAATTFRTMVDHFLQPARQNYIYQYIVTRMLRENPRTTLNWEWLYAISTHIQKGNT